MAGVEKSTCSAENTSVPRNAERKKSNNSISWKLLLAYIVAAVERLTNWKWNGGTVVKRKGKERLSLMMDVWIYDRTQARHWRHLLLPWRQVHVALTRDCTVCWAAPQVHCRLVVGGKGCNEVEVHFCMHSTTSSFWMCSWFCHLERTRIALQIYCNSKVVSVTFILL